MPAIQSGQPIMVVQSYRNLLQPNTLQTFGGALDACESQRTSCTSSIPQDRQGKSRILALIDCFLADANCKTSAIPHGVTNEQTGQSQIMMVLSQNFQFMRSAMDSPQQTCDPQAPLCLTEAERFGGASGAAVLPGPQAPSTPQTPPVSNQPATPAPPAPATPAPANNASPASTGSRVVEVVITVRKGRRIKSIEAEFD